jgi:hypothetical protein
VVVVTPADLEAMLRRVVREELARALRVATAPQKPRTPRKAESDRHRELVAQLRMAGLGVGAFRRVVEQAVGACFEDAPKIIPDAYGFRADGLGVVVYEVCVAHWITRKKRAALRAWREWLAQRGWSIRLIRVDVQGCMVGIDLDSGELDAESRQRVIDILTRKIEP